MSRDINHVRDSSLVFREVFNNEEEVRQNGGTPTAVTFNGGKGTFDGTSSKINYDIGLNITGTVRIKCTPTNTSNNLFLIEFRGTNNDGTGYAYLDVTTGNLSISSGTAYVNGVASTSTTTGVVNDIVITGIPIVQGTGANKTLIGSQLGDTFEFLGTIDSVEIWNRTLSAEEVESLYLNQLYKEPVRDLVGDWKLGRKDETKGATLQSSSFEDQSYTTFSGASSSGFTATSDGGATHRAGTADEIAYTTGKRYLVEFDLTLNSGTAPTITLAAEITGSADANIETASSGSNSITFTATATATGVIKIYNSSTATNYTISNLTIKEVQANDSSPQMQISTTDVITNGGFDSDTGWDVPAGWEISGGTANGTMTGATLAQTGVLTVGKNYRLTLDIPSYTTGTLYFDSGAGKTKTWTSSGTKTYDFIAQGTQIRFYGGTVTLSLDNVSVKEIVVPGWETSSNNGALVNFPTTIPYIAGPTGRADTALTFDGSDDYIDLGEDKPNDGTGDITISAWINPTGFGESGAGKILDNEQLSLITFNTNSLLRFVSDGSSIATSANDSISLGVWQHVLVTRNAAGDETNFYINGVLSGTANQDSGTPVAGTTNTFIGNNEAGSRTFDGNISKLKIFSRILGTQEIRELYYAGGQSR
jgi:hypothetical protein